MSTKEGKLRENPLLPGCDILHCLAALDLRQPSIPGSNGPQPGTQLCSCQGGARLLAFSSKRLDFFCTSLYSSSPLSYRKGCSCTHFPNILSCSSEKKTGDVFFLFLSGAPTSSVSSPSVIISPPPPSSSPSTMYSSPSMKSSSSPRTTLGVSLSSEGANNGGKCG